jgi:hypothetical protein
VTPQEGVVTITAIVHAPDGVRFVATGVSRDAVATRIAAYVRERCEHVLCADAASEVHTLLALGNIDSAITAYFERVGERWEDERLELFTGERNGARWTSQEPMLIDARR